jgi:hypothetical protein
MATLSRTVVIPLGDYATNIYPLAEQNVQNQATRFYFEVRRCTSADPTIWPNSTTVLDLKMEISTDAGVTWNFLAGFRAVGGIIRKVDGTELPISFVDVSLPAGNQRRIRGTAEVIEGPLRTEGFFEARNRI